MKNSLSRFLDRVHASRRTLLVSIVGGGLLFGLPVGPVLHWLLAVFIVVTILALSASQTYRLHVATHQVSKK
jgi:hypothetical protein